MPIVLHIARRPYNGHVDWLAELQSRFGVEAKVCLLSNRETGARPYHSDFSMGTTKLLHFLKKADILHLHGDLTCKSEEIGSLLRSLPRSCRIVQQYYHEKSRVGRVWDRSVPTCIIAKKAAILEPNLHRVPMVVPHWRKELKPKIQRNARLRVVYAPTDERTMLKYGGTRGKGFSEISRVLERLDTQRFDVQVITNLNWTEAMAIKRSADVCIDELVTGGYGQCSLESLSQGTIVIGNVLPEVQELLPTFYPFISSTTAQLQSRIEDIGNMPWHERQARQQAGVDWIKQYYSEKYLFEAYQGFYDYALNKKHEVKVSKTVSVAFNNGKLKPIQTEEPIPHELWELPPEIEESMPGKPLKIVQIARTNCAGAIWRIHEAINRYSPHSCRTITFSNRTNNRVFQHDILIQNYSEVMKAIREADVLHFHNWIDHNAKELATLRPLMTGKKVVLQYHTEPEMLKRAYPGVDVIKRRDVKTLVIAQKHVRFYPHSYPVPNMVDPDHELLKPLGVHWNNKPLKVIYSPSDTKGYQDYTNTCCGKGYPEMMPILKRLEGRGIIQLTVVTDMTWEELMPLKRKHDVCIDECVTGGYHLCSLESLAQGLITIGWLDDKTQEAIHNIVGTKTELPWLNTHINDLEATLTKLRFSSAEEIAALKAKGRDWIMNHWHPSKLLRHFISAYGEEDRPIIISFRRMPMLPIYRQPATVDKSLLNIKNAWAGERVIIWGNGPSAKEYVDQNFGSARHIGTNAATKLRSEFDAYCISDRRFFHNDEKRSIADNAPGVRVMLAHLRDLVGRKDDVSFLATLGGDGFCSDVSKGVFHGYSVVWVAIQVAIWAGCKDIVLVGCEHNYSNGRCYEEGKDKAPVDLRNIQRIVANYSRITPILQQAGVLLSTAGPSVLQSAGVPCSL